MTIKNKLNGSIRYSDLCTNVQPFKCTCDVDQWGKKFILNNQISLCCRLIFDSIMMPLHI